jgi:ribonuclease HI
MDEDTTLYYCDAAVDVLRRASGIAVIVRNRAGQILDAASCSLEGMTNNEAEYEAVILGLELARSRPPPHSGVILLTDSQIVVGQVGGQFAVRDPKLAPRHERASCLLAGMPGATIAHLPRERNRLADALAAEAMEAALEQAGMRPRVRRADWLQPAQRRNGDGR